MSRLTRSTPSTWNRTWFFWAERMISTGSSVSVSTRASSLYERAGTTMLVSSTASSPGIVVIAIR